MAIRNPPEWALGSLGERLRSVSTNVQQDYFTGSSSDTTPAIRRIGLDDLRYALRQGFTDFAAYRSDVIFLCVIYPVVGLALARVAFGYDMLPLVFPLVSGFALVGPFAAVGLNELSRRRELGLDAGFFAAFSVFRSPAIGKILTLGLTLMVLFLFWIVTAQIIYNVTLGPAVPASMSQFVHDVFLTRPGLMMILLGIGTGFLFAVASFILTVVSFPLLLDRNASLEVAVKTSLRAVATNPWPMAVWGLVISIGLIAGSIPALLGLAIVMPTLGHATWHLYRRMVQW